MAELILGPVLRYVGETEATVWVETDSTCEVGVLGSTEPTFTVAGHHYALVHVTGLEPGSVNAYEVELDGESAWPPPDYDLPAPTIRTRSGDEPVHIVFGSCRVALPHEKPYVLPKDEHEDGREFDALYTLAKELRDAPRGLARPPFDAGRPGLRRRGLTAGPRAHPRDPRHLRAAGRGGRELRGVHLALPRVLGRPADPLAALHASRPRWSWTTTTWPTTGTSRARGRGDEQDVVVARARRWAAS